MKTLIVEDDFTSRIALQGMLSSHGPAHIAVNGREAVEAVAAAMKGGEPYDLICLDIMMPNMDGHEALNTIRGLEEQAGILPGKGAKIIMVTPLSDSKNVLSAFREQCDGYITKPVDRSKLIKELQKLSLIG